MKSTFEIYHANMGSYPTSIKYDFIKFSDNTIQLKTDANVVHTPTFSSSITIVANILDSDGIIALMQLKDYFDFYYSGVVVNLIMPYVPYARYDRRMLKMDSFSLKVFCKTINSLEFNKVLVDDPHSQIVESLIDNCHVRYSQYDALKQVISKSQLSTYDYIISPDMGAMKKASIIGEKLNKEVLIAMKKRDVETGYTVFDRLIVDSSVSLEGKSVLIIDDICDNGGTFVNLAEHMKIVYGISKVDLFVTHLILKNGGPLDYVDSIFCFNDIGSVIGYPRNVNL